MSWCYLCLMSSCLISLMSSISNMSNMSNMSNDLMPY